MYPNVKRELPGADIDFHLDQSGEPVTLHPDTASDFAHNDNINNLADKSAQNADNLEVTQNIPSINDTSGPETPTTESTFNTEDPTDTYHNNTLIEKKRHSTR